MNLGNTVLNKINHTQKNAYCTVPFLSKKEKKKERKARLHNSVMKPQSNVNKSQASGHYWGKQGEYQQKGRKHLEARQNVPQLLT